MSARHHARTARHKATHHKAGHTARHHAKAVHHKAKKKHTAVHYTSTAASQRVNLT